MQRCEAAVIFNYGQSFEEPIRWSKLRLPPRHRTPAPCSVSRSAKRCSWDRLPNLAGYTIHMRIPHTQLSPAALRAIVEEFVTRDGTDHSSVERRIGTVLRHLDAGRLELHFDDETETCNILPV